MNAPAPWPALRDDLELLPGPVVTGAPTWTLYDPARHRYVRLGSMEMEILQRWDLADPDTIARVVREQTTFDAQPADVTAFAAFLRQAGLTTAQTSADSALLARQARKPPLLSWILHHYLFLRVRLCNPDPVLKRCAPLTNWLFTRQFCTGLVLAVGLALILVVQQWSLYATGFMHLITPQGAIGIAMALTCSKVVHELGHGIAARHFGCRVPAMGVAFLVLCPVLWTDTTDAWRLVRARDRLVIDCAGMVAEIMLATLATILWSIVPDGPFRDSLFTLSSSTWILTLSVNLSPLMRFDGYYILSDLMGIPNLQERAFAWTRWRTRKFLFGMDTPPPEVFPAYRGLMLTGYSMATWLYRFFLFTGIALVVYHAVFPALGVILMGIEIWFFVARPIMRELAQWARQALYAPASRRVHVTGAVFAILLAFLVLPWSHSVRAPAVLRAEGQSMLYTQDPGQVVRLLPTGSMVRAGETVAELRSPQLDHDRAVSIARLATLDATLSERMFGVEDTASLDDTRDKIEQETAERLRAEAAIRQLTLTAPFAGMLVDVPPEIHVGDTLKQHEYIGSIITDDHTAIEAYVYETDISFIQPGAKASFLANSPGAKRITGHVQSISVASVPEIDALEQASLYGGHIKAHRDESSHRIVPEEAVYQVIILPDGPLPPARRRIKGMVRIHATATSFVQRTYRKIVSVFMGEAGL
ncbi:HlyD family efflux transporter periplasmic adaptor subunit [Komagataeibacter sp. FXV3]|uniref:HlyD family efflux transporter periplasmic adaptor subunit n=1 Tax=Komagataeibacter sp. FXV3 TaxID=2608998 RepID=UPI00187B38E1|nr:HlyD family efflux transporter periplasmic adaptor subunit [Komagataeibacter sp. FXV3]MBE7728329.1 HlyD family efflux transporter periplasmic adaptor subunit [Komagataeibacter sp. FXV3]